MKYTITEVNKQQSWVKLEVTFDDGSVYLKRMMVPLESDSTVKTAIEQWLADYLLERKALLPAYDSTSLTKQPYFVAVADLPTPTKKRPAAKGGT